MAKNLSPLMSEEQYVYDSNLKKNVLGEHELDIIKKEADKIENQVSQIIRDPSEVQELAFKLARSTENEILGLFSTSILSTDKNAWYITEIPTIEKKRPKIKN